MVGGWQRAETVNHGAGANGGQKLLGIFSEQDERGVIGRLFEQLEQAVGCFFHEGRSGEYGKCAPCLDGRAIVGGVDRLAHLAEFDEQLRRVGRNDENVGVGLDEDARFAFVGVAHVVAGTDGFVHQRVEIGGRGDARAIGADAAKVGQAVGFGRLEAVDGLGQHKRQSVFARATRPRKDERMRETVGAHALAQVRDGGRVADEVLEAHGVRITGVGFQVSGVTVKDDSSFLLVGVVVAPLPVFFLLGVLALLIVDVVAMGFMLPLCVVNILAGPVDACVYRATGGERGQRDCRRQQEPGKIPEHRMHSHSFRYESDAAKRRSGWLGLLNVW